MKNLQLALRIALTHLLSKKKQSLVAMLGVTFGISMFIVMISFMNGVNEFLMELTLDGSPHVHMYNPVKTERQPLLSEIHPEKYDWVVVHHQRPKQELPKIKDGLQLLEQIRKTPGIAQASPQLSSQVFFNNGSSQFAGSVIGIDVVTENVMYKLYEKMISGKIDRLLTNREGILMGERLAKKMNVNTGDRVSLTTPQGTTFLLNVVGIFAFGISTIDDTRTYVTLQTAQKILGKSADYITDINMKMHDYTTAAQVAGVLEKTYGYKAEDWMAANASILAGELIRNIMTYVVAVTMLVVAGFGIYNIMNMTVVNKLRDIAILKATGFEGKNIIAIFLMQSVIIGITGALFGVLLGAGISYMIDQVPFPARDIIKLETFPITYKWYHYSLALIFGTLTTLLAGYFPSKKASKVDPVAIIRG
jgi:lipoprotein-releasing system permease protein